MKLWLPLLLLVVSTALPIAANAQGAPKPIRALPQARCTANATKAFVRRFVRSYGSGQVGTAERFWAPAPRFQWFSAGAPGARLGSAAYVRSTLGSYFAARARAHERIRLTELGAGYDPKRHIVNIGGKLIRSADHFRPVHHDFKGAADCVSGHPTLIVWSM
jgi:hypothetical protein